MRRCGPRQLEGGHHRYSLQIARWSARVSNNRTYAHPDIATNNDLPSRPGTAKLTITVPEVPSQPHGSCQQTFAHELEIFRLLIDLTL